MPTYLNLISAVGANVWVFLHLLRAFGPGRWLLAAVPWFALMSVAYPVQSLLHGRGALAWVLALAENIWLPFLTVCCALFLVTDAFFLARRAYRKHCAPSREKRPYRVFVVRLLAVALLFTGYGLYEAYTPEPIHYTLHTGKLPEGLTRLRLVFVSDMHINPWIGPRTIRRVVELIREQHPDMILLGGDIVDTENAADKTQELEALHSLDAPFGKFAVLGNHEALRGVDQAVAFLEAAGFTVLRRQFVETHGLIVAGVDDPRVAAAEGTVRHLPDALLREARQAADKAFVILLQHRPAVDQETLGLFDLQLSGHTHGGQIWPLYLVFDSVYNTRTGLWFPGSGKQGAVIVSVGSGFSRVPLRFLTPPEIVVIDLLPDA